MNTTYPLKDCKYRVYYKGCKIPKTHGYPCDTWGSYLPGDEPGYYCSETQMRCEEHQKINIEDCFRFTLMFKDEETDRFYTIHDNQLYYEEG